ncbi:metallophosphoesterase family protein [Neobacillus fumarioli]|uniref:metallophosphoesterase family protein n=1 Tax=Neobacillus fumarioli TaxID=105229 RepID=UPI0008353529|nr:DNA repair exonuclease [Neobacillus fumarioli]
MKQISFIHAADLHLDSPMAGLKHLPAELFNRTKESTFTSLQKLTQTAIRLQVDFVIIAGDIFDGEDRSLKAQSRFRKEMLKLEAEGIPVYVVHGNHDHLNGSWVHLDMPKNVYVFPSEVETMKLTTKSGEIVHLYGFSYPVRHVVDRKITEYKKQEGADFHIGILHGNESSGTEHENYAPFTIKELEEKNFDYWALGHIHKRMILSETPPIIYPGNIQGRNKKETGAKGFYHVILSDVETKMEFCEASDIIWEEVHIDASSAHHFHEILKLCQAAIQQFRKENQGTFLTIYLNNVQIEDALERRSLDHSLLELLQENEKDEESFVWVVELITVQKQQIDKEQLKKEANFYTELFSIIEHYEHKDRALAPVYEHPLGRKYVSPLAETEQRELIQQAEKLLIELLYEE